MSHVWSQGRLVKDKENSKHKDSLGERCREKCETFKDPREPLWGKLRDEQRCGSRLTWRGHGVSLGRIWQCTEKPGNVTCCASPYKISFQQMPQLQFVTCIVLVLRNIPLLIIHILHTVLLISVSEILHPGSEGEKKRL